MVCKKCGAMITDSSADCCQVCCAPLEEQNQNSNTQQLGMKWANFLGYFVFWFVAITSIILGLWFLVIATTDLYSDINGIILFTAFCIIVIGVINILAALSIINRKRKAKNMVILVHAANIIGDALLCFTFLFMGILIVPSISSIIIQILMIYINCSYFEHRSNIFVN